MSFDVTRARGAAVVPPLKGDPLLIDPRRENPLDFLWLDLATFFFVPVPGLPPRDAERATYTRDVLGLNARDALVRARRVAFEHFCNHLRCYAADRDKGASATVLAGKVALVREMNHVTVWVEMKRQRTKYPTLASLFAAVPEALMW